MPEIRTELEIAAPPQTLWNVLADFKRWPEWNPFLAPLTGAAEVGSKIELKVRSGPLPIKLRVKVLVAQPERELMWKGKFVSERVVAGEHYFIIESLGLGRSHFIHGEKFTGRIAPLAWAIIQRETRKGYAKMNAAFKARCETGAGL